MLRSVAPWLLASALLQPASAQCEVEKLLPSWSGNQSFGAPLALDGDILVVGALDSDGSDTGAAFVFERIGGSWQETDWVAGEFAGDFFGGSVAVDGSTIVVGAPGHDDSMEGDSRGAAYVYSYSTGSGLSFVQELIAASGKPGDQFGISVAIVGDAILVGAQQYDLLGGSDHGAAFAFVHDSASSSWQELAAPLIASDKHPGDWFGVGLAMDGTEAVIGARNGDGLLPGTGTAYVFARDDKGTAVPIDDEWLQQAGPLSASDGVPGSDFGLSVRIHNDRFVAGAQGHPGGGQAYVFERDGSGWSEQAILTADDSGDTFGVFVGLHDDIVLVGALGDSARLRNALGR